MKFLKYAFLIVLISVSLVAASAFFIPSLRSDLLTALSETKARSQYLLAMIASRIEEKPVAVAKEKTSSRGEASSVKNSKPAAENSAARPSSADTSKTVTEKRETSDNPVTLPATGDALTQKEDEGFIFVVSTPESARVKVDDIAVGYTPITVKVSPPGLYEVTVESRYCDSWTQTVIVNPFEVKKVYTQLQKGNATLTILSNPQEALVLIDDQTKGKTPLTIKNLESGRHSIRLEKGQLGFFDEIDIGSGEKTVLQIALQTIYANLKVESNPSGANLYLNGILKGTTPITLERASVGKQQIILVKGESLAFVDSVLVSSDQNNVLSATLQPKSDYTDSFSSRLFVDTELKNSFTYLNGKFRGTAPIEIDSLRYGEHEVMIVKTLIDGTYTFRKKIFMNPHDHQKISAKTDDFVFKKM
jgi:hypothetical protein